LVHKVALLGNCQMQYIGAALRKTTSFDVRVVGELFDGPVFFEDTKPEMILRKDFYTWLLEDKDVKILVIEQAFAGVKSTLEEQLAQQGIDCSYVRLPFLKFDAFHLRPNEDKAALDLEVRKTVRTDRIHNEMVFTRAGYDLIDLDIIEIMMRYAPYSYASSHFTGAIYAAVFSGLRRGEALSFFGNKLFKQVIDALSVDKGIAHLNAGKPIPEVARAMKLTWSFDAEVLRYRRMIMENAADVLKTIGAEKSLGENVVFGIYRIARQQFEKTGDPACLDICRAIYNDRRRYAKWAVDIFKGLLKLGRQEEAVAFIQSHLEWDDTRNAVSKHVADDLKAIGADMNANMDREIYPLSSAS